MYPFNIPTDEHVPRPITRGSKPSLKIPPPLEKYVGHSLKVLNIVQKF